MATADMRLELGTFPVEEVVFANRTALEGRTLLVDREELLQKVRAEGPFTRVGAELARPGESVRIIHALDLVEPRVKASGRGAIFPGVLGPPETVGQGRTHRLAGLGVVSTGQVATRPNASSREATIEPASREAIIDLAGPGAAVNPYADLIHLVLELELPEDLSLAQWAQTMRRGVLRAAAYLGGAVREQQPPEIDVYDLNGRPRSSDLPTVVYICELNTCSEIRDQIYYGRGMVGALPVLAHPNELMDGALVSQVYHIACSRNPTYLHQNDPVVRELYRLHGSQLNFAGVILHPGFSYDGIDKERNAAYSARLARMVGADCAILTVEGGGHGILDVMLTCQKCEQAGVKTAVIVSEMLDPNKPDATVPDSVPEADALVSVGNLSEPIRLPAVDRVLGGDRLLFTDLDPRGSLEIWVRYIFCSTNQNGAGRLRGFEI